MKFKNELMISIFIKKINNIYKFILMDITFVKICVI